MNDDELISRRKKQNADRIRAYRKRKKDLGAMPSTSTVQSGDPPESRIGEGLKEGPNEALRGPLNATRVTAFRASKADETRLL
ncbi:hypothetical protein EVAR_93924_1 [Eumeta japonica]|uniref:Uncharacterized protein n=1 Tax=Eumeta variegata TaxID=151549 RepID=A0A4C1TP47_EUMVA|nr:hypothetical protein EVAR_93924_1 [Eumeta japonica]